MLVRSLARALRRAEVATVCRPAVVCPAIAIRSIAISVPRLSETPNAVYSFSSARLLTCSADCWNDLLAMAINKESVAPSTSSPKVKQLTAVDPVDAQTLATPSTVAAVPAEEKAIVDIKVDKVHPYKRLNVIKEVQAITGLGLKESMEFVDQLPKLLKKDVERDEAVKLVAKLKELGAGCSLE